MSSIPYNPQPQSISNNGRETTVGDLYNHLAKKHPQAPSLLPSSPTDIDDDAIHDEDQYNNHTSTNPNHHCSTSPTVPSSDSAQRVQQQKNGYSHQSSSPQQYEERTQSINHDLSVARSPQRPTRSSNNTASHHTQQSIPNNQPQMRNPPPPSNQTSVSVPTPENSIPSHTFMTNKVNKPFTSPLRSSHSDPTIGSESFVLNNTLGMKLKTATGAVIADSLNGGSYVERVNVGGRGRLLKRDGSRNLMEDAELEHSGDIDMGKQVDSSRLQQYDNHSLRNGHLQLTSAQGGQHGDTVQNRGNDQAVSDNHLPTGRSQEARGANTHQGEMEFDHSSRHDHRSYQTYTNAQGSPMARTHQPHSNQDHMVPVQDRRDARPGQAHNNGSNPHYNHNGSHAQAPTDQITHQNQISYQHDIQNADHGHSIGRNGNPNSSEEQADLQPRNLRQFHPPTPQRHMSTESQYNTPHSSRTGDMEVESPEITTPFDPTAAVCRL
jgi:hypothetical protein